MISFVRHCISFTISISSSSLFSVSHCCALLSQLSQTLESSFLDFISVSESSCLELSSFSESSLLNLSTCSESFLLKLSSLSESSFRADCYSAVIDSFFCRFLFSSSSCWLSVLQNSPSFRTMIFAAILNFPPFLSCHLPPVSSHLPPPC